MTNSTDVATSNDNPPMVSEERLLPCPFCGEKPALIEEAGTFALGCTRCGLSVGHCRADDGPTLVAAWNHRTPTSTGEVTEEMVERATEALWNELKMAVDWAAAVDIAARVPESTYVRQTAAFRSAMRAALTAAPAAGKDYWLHYDHQTGRWLVEEQPPKVIRKGADVIHVREVSAKRQMTAVERVRWHADIADRGGSFAFAEHLRSIADQGEEAAQRNLAETSAVGKELVELVDGAAPAARPSEAEPRRPRLGAPLTRDDYGECEVRTLDDLDNEAVEQVEGRS